MVNKQRSHIIASIGTALVLLIVFLLLWFICIKSIREPEEEGVEVAFGVAEDGGGYQQQETEAPSQQPVAVPPAPQQPSNNDLMTQDDEEALALQHQREQEEKDRQRAEQERIRQEREARERAEAEQRAREQAANDSLARLRGDCGTQGCGYAFRQSGRRIQDSSDLPRFPAPPHFSAQTARMSFCFAGRVM